MCVYWRRSVAHVMNQDIRTALLCLSPGLRCCRPLRVNTIIMTYKFHSADRGHVSVWHWCSSWCSYSVFGFTGAGGSVSSCTCSVSSCRGLRKRCKWTFLHLQLHARIKVKESDINVWKSVYCLMKNLRQKPRHVCLEVKMTCRAAAIVFIIGIIGSVNMSLESREKCQSHRVHVLFHPTKSKTQSFSSLWSRR